jgi:hypothetical protein
VTSHTLIYEDISSYMDINEEALDYLSKVNDELLCHPSMYPLTVEDREAAAAFSQKLSVFVEEIKELRE